MSIPYFPHTEEDIRLMLEKLGVSSLDQLYSDVPEEFLFKAEFDLPESMSELEIRQHFQSLAAMNKKLTIFSGYGAYDHYNPAVIPYIISRSEFSTAYTPYQAEVSQGTLRYIFEWQSMICRLTGLDISNASMYDGPTAAAEAIFMAFASTKKKTRVLVADSVLPHVKAVVETYMKYRGYNLSFIPVHNGRFSIEALQQELQAQDVAAFLVPQINRYGIIEDLSGLAECLHEKGALLVCYSDPSSLAVLKTPAEYGADIACGDAQTLGLPLSYGGPYIGFIACKEAYMRKLPGRIVGETTDLDGKRAFVLTLQAREQHIRREKATSNICSNQGLMALYATVYLAVMGPEGLKKVNELSSSAAHYLKAKLLETSAFEDPFPSQPFLKEFVLKPKGDVAALYEKLIDAGFFAALPIGDGFVNFCTTEKRTKEEIDALIKLFEK